MGGLALPTLVLAPAAGRRCSVRSEAGSRLGECREQAAHLSVSLGWGAPLSPGDRKDVMRAPAQQHQCACAWGCGGAGREDPDPPGALDTTLLVRRCHSAGLQVWPAQPTAELPKEERQGLPGPPGLSLKAILFAF